MTRPALAATLLWLSCALLAGCATVPESPNVEGTISSEGTMVAFDQPVQVGAIVVTPKSVVEDSRCPVNVLCVHAGRLIVRTRIDGPGWRKTVDLQLGTQVRMRGESVVLVSGEPQPVASRPTDPGAYRFGYAVR